MENGHKRAECTWRNMKHAHHQESCVPSASDHAVLYPSSPSAPHPSSPNSSCTPPLCGFETAEAAAMVGERGEGGEEKVAVIEVRRMASASMASQIGPSQRPQPAFGVFALLFANWINQVSAGQKIKRMCVRVSVCTCTLVCVCLRVFTICACTCVFKWYGAFYVCIQADICILM